MGRIGRIIQRYANKYLDRKVILVMDCVLSLCASLIVLMLVIYLTNSGRDVYMGPFTPTWIAASALGSLIAFLALRTHDVVIRHMHFRDMHRYVQATILKEAIMGLSVGITCIFNSTVFVALVIDLLLTLFFILAARLLMMMAYDAFMSRAHKQSQRRNVLVYGVGEKAMAIVPRLKNSPHYRIAGFLSSEAGTKTLKVSDLPVLTYSEDEDLQRLIERNAIGCILFPTDADLQAEKDGLVHFCIRNKVKTLICPPIDEVVDGRIMKSKVREVKIEDLLGREEIHISMDAIEANFRDKVVMVTGAAGSIGSELCRQLAGFGVRKLVLFDNGETPMHNLRLELEERFPLLDFVPVIGDVRQQARLEYAFSKWHPQVLFHAAAYKHVPLMEENPCEAVYANVIGTRNVADKCLEHGVEMMVMISTDKAVNPTNIMGCTKRLAEIYVQSLGLAVERGEVQGTTRFVTTRFGNVLGSNGSVIPRFRQQIECGGPVTVTDPRITRFFMTIPEACRLVMEAATMSTGNQIFVFDMGESVKIDTLARRMIELAGLEVGRDIEIEYVGLRPGEKLYEEVLSNKENTDPTPHERIRVARVREYSYAVASDYVGRLGELAVQVKIPEMVRLMKEVVPEFKSKNSEFEKYDK